MKALALVLLGAAAAACGNPFTIGPAVDDAAPSMSAAAVIDAGPSPETISPNRVTKPEAGTGTAPEAAPEAGHPEAGERDAPVQETGPIVQETGPIVQDAGPDAVDGAVDGNLTSDAAPAACQVPPPSLVYCPSGAPFSAPGQFCHAYYSAPTVGYAIAMPAACACSYTCACLLAHASPCDTAGAPTVLMCAGDGVAIVVTCK